MFMKPENLNDEKSDLSCLSAAREGGSLSRECWNKIQEREDFIA